MSDITELVKRLRAQTKRLGNMMIYPVNPDGSEAADALEAKDEEIQLLENKLRVALNAVKEDTARIVELMAYVERIANQKLTDEMDEHIKEQADYEGAYNYIVKEARDNLRATRAALNGEQG